jgi:class 3 adenylate cyclase
VLFGYPVAQENDAERAARAALAIQRALAEVNRKNADTGKPALSACIGIEIGPVVVDAAGEIYGDVATMMAMRTARPMSYPLVWHVRSGHRRNFRRPTD